MKSKFLVLSLSFFCIAGALSSESAFTKEGAIRGATALTDEEVESCVQEETKRIIKELEEVNAILQAHHTEGLRASCEEVILAKQKPKELSILEICDRFSDDFGRCLEKVSAEQKLKFMSILAQIDSVLINYQLPVLASETIREAQVKWEAYRDAECKVLDNIYLTNGVPNAVSCLDSMNRERIKVLIELLKTLESNS